MPRTSSAPPPQSALSRQDIELLAGLKGGMETLVKQVNTLQGGITNQMVDMQNKHDEQMRELNKRVIGIEEWKAVHLSAQSIMRWDKTAKTVEKYEDRWQLVLAIWGIITGLLGSAATLVYYYFQFHKR